MQVDDRFKCIRGFLDDQGRIHSWPAKQSKKRMVLTYMAQQFKAGEFYTEKEVNTIIDTWHLFGDYLLLRRGMVDAGLMQREKDGTRYWRTEES